jgi:hypothetical protein
MEGTGMRLGRIVGAAGVSLALAGWLVAGTSGQSPPATGQIRLVTGDGFSLASEEVAPGGGVIDTYRSRDATIKVIGRAGSSLSITDRRDQASGRRSVDVELATTRPKTIAEARTYGRSGRSAVSDLVALGVPRAQAIRDFGDLDVMDSARGRTSLENRPVAGTSKLPPIAAPTLNVSATTPYDTQCASLSYDGGRIVGYGCSTLFLIAASGGDWWFNNKYKFSAHSTDGSIFRPQRLFEVGWGLGWSAGNIVYDWAPEATVTRNECGSVSFSLFAKGFGISIDAPICPTKISPWNLSSVRSGSLWQGIERGQDYEAAIGVQAVHSPPNAAASYNSPFKLVWGPFPP